jgi:hypothetical protein
MITSGIALLDPLGKGRLTSLVQRQDKDNLGVASIKLKRELAVCEAVMQLPN